jgi:hypothetical protein
MALSAKIFGVVPEVVRIVGLTYLQKTNRIPRLLSVAGKIFDEDVS